MGEDLAGRFEWANGSDKTNALSVVSFQSDESSVKIETDSGEIQKPINFQKRSETLDNLVNSFKIHLKLIN